MGAPTNHDERLRRLVNDLPRLPPGGPWRKTVEYSVGGLEAVGVHDEYILVVSSTGRGVFDARSGTRVARDDSSPEDGWLREPELEASGIGPLEGVRVRLSGLYGGGLASSTGDGWTIATMAPRWPDVAIVLQAEWANLLCELSQPSRHAPRCQTIATVRELRAAGFSSDGRTLIVATSDSLVAYHRDKGQ